MWLKGFIDQKVAFCCQFVDDIVFLAFFGVFLCRKKRSSSRIFSIIEISKNQFFWKRVFTRFFDRENKKMQSTPQSNQCLRYCIFTKHSQFMFMINVHISVYQYVRCNCKLWNVPWLSYIIL